MNTETILLIVKDYGYWALFFTLWLGFFGLPIPNEAIIMTSGLIASKSYLEPIPTFVVTYVGVICSLTTLYLLGRFWHEVISRFINRVPKVNQYVGRAEHLITKHGPLALVFGYFIPGVRHFVPFLVGNSKMPYRTFALFGYTITFLWTIVLYTTGYFSGQHMDEIISALYSYGAIILLFLFSVVVIAQLIKKRRKIKEKHPS
ncbi:DedA family protein [Metabacillus iocasae]|uniref:Membrane protein DedA with SNARE-associated domain n=1 Tax=Priestia iocasae TaxID=2291674 RepID=A0ABS2QZ59_9BACI|nr:DedA family protein [Metabacillus iocasae]MBM7704773.1 membrane protein DedA with SNARE-associated domain [Metabacillus iocasae]